MVKKKEYKKNKFTPAQDILNRLKWQPELSGGRVSIGYEYRFKGVLTTSMDSFEKSDIPMHRIRVFYIEDKKIWDRNERIDLLTGCDLEKLLEEIGINTGDYNEYSNNTDDDNNNNNDNLNHQQNISEHSIQHLPRVTLSKKKKRKHIQQYVPSDSLEKWMLSVHDPSLALDFPTHISQKGGYYHIPDNLNQELLSRWSTSVSRSEEFYMEEVRGDLSPLYFDLDLKSIHKEPVEIVSSQDNQQHWMPCIMSVVRQFIGEVTSSLRSRLQRAIVIASHGDWRDHHSTAQWKSGYRIYFPRVWVDQNNLTCITRYLGKELADTIGNYPGQPQDWAWKEVVDMESCKHERARMLGSVKWRRGRILGRIYHFCGVIDGNGAVDQHMTNELQLNVPLLLRMTSVRLGIRDVPRLVLIGKQKKLVEK